MRPGLLDIKRIIRSDAMDAAYQAQRIAMLVTNEKFNDGRIKFISFQIDGFLKPDYRSLGFKKMRLGSIKIFS